MKTLIAGVMMTGMIASGAFAAEQVTYKYPTKAASGSSYAKYIFVSATNGTQFCKEMRGNSNDRIVAGEMLCGEDESSYAEFDPVSQTWQVKSTGSKNQCYPVFKEITCSHR
ncbi:hypothetical protein GCM10009092_36490 [Bowmanella denitrificans]|uniref:Uncharacterized protein n=1 Tax=Bowmanella denitrificans TaxID=366582 RepID=A0ABN0XNT4_9ALTE